MEIDDTDARAVVKYFRSVNPNMKEGIISWVKGMPIELDNIYFCLAEKNKCIAIWTDFRIQQMDQRTMERIFGRISLLDCEFFMYHNNKRYRIGFRVKGVIK